MPYSSEILLDEMGGTGTILIADDDPVVLKFCERVLSLCGYQTLTAQDGLAALQIAGGVDCAIDLLLTDMSMPGLSGPELAEQVRTMWPTTRVLYASGHSNAKLAKLLPQRDTLPILAKPYTVSELALAVKRALSHDDDS